MRDEKLKEVLIRIDLNKCDMLIDDYIYYICMPVRQRYSIGGGGYGFDNSKYEFLVIAPEQKKQAIILRCGTEDLHWHVLKPFRKNHVLSNSLRTGIIRKVWPENTKVSCCQGGNDGIPYREKIEMTRHLANIAGLHFIED